MEFTAATIAGFLKGEIEGNPDIKVNTVAKIEEGHQGALSFLANPKYEHYIYTTASSVVLVNKSFIPSGKIDATLIKVIMHMKPLPHFCGSWIRQDPEKREFTPLPLLNPLQKLVRMFISGHMHISEKIALLVMVVLSIRMFISEIIPDWVSIAQLTPE